MKVGIYLPQVGGVASPENVKRVAMAVEANGYDSLWTFDHVVLRPDQGSDYPYSEDGRFLIPAETAFLEPLTLITFAAAVTERVELGTAVLVAPMRAPVLHAKLMATLDHLAGGRLILGAGVGWWKEEFEALSMPFDRRGARMDEYLQVLRDLWENEIGTFEGEFYNTKGWYSRPQPPRRVPILLGGNNARQLRRAGRFADGYLANPAMLDTLEEDWALVKSTAESHGRDPSQLTLAINRITVLAEDTIDEAAETLNEMKSRGFDHAIANLHPGSDAEAVLAEFAGQHLQGLQSGCDSALNPNAVKDF